MGKMSDAISKLVSPINKLIDLMGQACGKWYEPIHVKRMAKANSEAMKIMQEAIGSSPELNAAYNNGMIKIDNEQLNGLVVRGMQRAVYQETMKQQNIESVADKAYGLLENEPPVTDEPVDNDWMARFINSVESVSDDDMQLLWARVLAGEIKKPKSYSLRTLESLKNLSKDEAILFQKLSDYVIIKDDSCFFVNEDGIEFNGNSVYNNLQDMLVLSECGITNVTPLLQTTFTYPVGGSDKYYNDNYILMFKNITDKKQQIAIQVFNLTSFGKQLMEIMKKNTSDEFFIAFSKYLKAHYANQFEFALYKIIDKTENEVRFDKSVDYLMDGTDSHI